MIPWQTLHKQCCGENQVQRQMKYAEEDCCSNCEWTRIHANSRDIDAVIQGGFASNCSAEESLPAAAPSGSHPQTTFVQRRTHPVPCPDSFIRSHFKVGPACRAGLRGLPRRATRQVRINHNPTPCIARPLQGGSPHGESPFRQKGPTCSNHQIPQPPFMLKLLDFPALIADVNVGDSAQRKPSGGLESVVSFFIASPERRDSAHNKCPTVQTDFPPGSHH